MKELNFKPGYHRMKFNIDYKNIKKYVSNNNICDDFINIIDENIYTKDVFDILSFFPEYIENDTFNIYVECINKYIEIICKRRKNMLYDTSFIGKLITALDYCSFIDKRKSIILFDHITKNYLDKNVVSIIALNCLSFIFNKEYILILNKYYPDMVPIHTLFDEIITGNNRDILNVALMLFDNIDICEYSKYLLLNVMILFEDHRKFNDKIIAKLLSDVNYSNSKTSDMLNYSLDNNFISKKTYDKWNKVILECIL